MDYYGIIFRGKMNKKIIELVRLASEFEKMAQQAATAAPPAAPQVSAQPSEIQAALQKAGLWEMSAQVSPLLDRANIQDTEGTVVQLVVGAGDTVTFNVTVTPNNPNAAGRLKALLNQAYAGKISQALKAAGIKAETPVTVNWLRFDQMTPTSTEGQQ